MKRVGIVLAAVLVAAVGLAGCSSPSTSVTDAFQPTIGAADVAKYSDVTAKLDDADGTIRYPLDAYQMTWADTREVAAANDIIIDRCLHKRGMSNPLTQLNRFDSPEPEDRTFGLWNETDAADYGYGSRLDANADRGNEMLAAESKAWGDAQANCYATANVVHELTYTNADSLADNSVVAVGTSGYWQSMNYAAGTKAWKDARKQLWGCWRSRGLTPLTGDSDWTPQLPKDQKSQIRVALIDVSCKKKTGFEQKMADIVAQYQAAYVAKNEAALDRQLSEVRKVVARAEAIVDG